ncbi:enoyl-CoA hydratase-related protein [Henriciella aquimarina]|uniref:enoyl-CoA hydratase-related protein n=1 Tax=Henriciella aquimarina TaxID=545261 RepID=UPI000A042F33|nr:enoyl-CoA hydratase-related protein [Henriciella aquimarina]
MSTTFITSEVSGQILTITLNRPQALNSLNAAACFELAAIFDDYQDNDELRVAIITGTGDRAFCAGHDLVDDFFEPMPESGWAGLSLRKGLHKPLIAAVNGLALGGGWEIAMMCDVVVADQRATFGLPEPKVGFAALGGGARILPHRVPYHIAMGLLLTGKSISAEKAAQLGLVNDVTEPGAVMAGAYRWAREMLTCSPKALYFSKQLAQASMEPDSLRGPLQSLEQELAGELAQSKDVREGIAAFMQKRPPVWTGH